MYAVVLAAAAWMSARRALDQLSSSDPEREARQQALQEAETELARTVTRWQGDFDMIDRRMQHIVRRAGEEVVTADQLAGELDLSPRTVYRLIKDLRGKGVPIRGEIGYGYRIFKKGPWENGQGKAGARSSTAA